MLGRVGSGWVGLGRVHSAAGVDPWRLGVWLLMSTKQHAKIRADSAFVAPSTVRPVARRAESVNRGHVCNGARPW